ncbi:MAG TPA: DUF4876 domain-containing protein [Candidatus Krumholzibacterium sp.]|nr:DUF4876 domain-containing protein [Candidatus Krumholzibacterium sp.]
MKQVVFFVLAAALFAVSCGVEKPGMVDSGGVIEVTVVDTSGALPGTVQGVPFVLGEALVSIQSRTHVYASEETAGVEGIAVFSVLPSGDYSIFARKEVPVGAQKKVFSGYADVTVEGNTVVADTVYTTATTVTEGIIINEIFYCGSDRSKYYFYDQFVELYNPTADTLYLDGVILTRNSPSDRDEIEDIDVVRATYAFQFPGTPVIGREHPIAPGQYIIIAADAIDHTQYADNSVDLSIADWECFNALGHDYDVLDVPNLNSIHPESGVDYMINLSHEAVVITTGEFWDWEIYINSNGYESIRLTMPLSTVIDGVEYASSTDKVKELTVRVDAGFAGIGCSKYSGQSTERREVGVDTNHSTFDFILLDRPTPGYSHLDQE